MNIKEAAAAIGCSTPTIYALAKRGELTIIRDTVLLRRPARIPIEDIERLLAKRRAADPPA